MLQIDHERRSSERILLSRPCKVFEPRSGKYTPATTCNVSRTGMMLRLHRPLELEAGDRLYIGVPPRSNPAWVRSSEMQEALVARALPVSSGERVVAVQLAVTDDRWALPFLQAA